MPLKLIINSEELQNLSRIPAISKKEISNYLSDILYQSVFKRKILNPLMSGGNKKVTYI